MEATELKNKNKESQENQVSTPLDVGQELEKILNIAEARDRVIQKILNSPKAEEKKVVERKMTTINKQQFLKWYPSFYNIELTAKKIDIDQSTFQKWMKKDPEFASAFYELKLNRNAMVEDKLLQLILSGDGPSIRYFLDRQHPEYKPKSETTIIPNGKTFTEILWEQAKHATLEEERILGIENQNGGDTNQQ